MACFCKCTYGLKKIVASCNYTQLCVIQCIGHWVKLTTICLFSFHLFNALTFISKSSSLEKLTSACQGRLLSSQKYLVVSPEAIFFIANKNLMRNPLSFVASRLKKIKNYPIKLYTTMRTQKSILGIY